MMDMVKVHGPCHVTRNIPGQVKMVQEIQTFKLSLVSVRSIQTNKQTKEQVQEICNGRKEASFRL